MDIGPDVGQATATALRDLARRGEASLGLELSSMANRVRDLVPELVGLSLGLNSGGLTLTLVASAEQVAALDAAQYLDGGPCVEDMERSDPLEVDMGDLLDEARWQLYARASAASGVATSLFLPIMDGGRALGGVNLYAGTVDAFEGKHEALAGAVGPAARVALTSADLSFWTAKTAMEAPARVREGSDVNVALGVISALQGINIPIARERLRNAAARAGITELQAAQAIKQVRTT